VTEVSGVENDAAKATGEGAAEAGEAPRPCIETAIDAESLGKELGELGLHVEQLSVLGLAGTGALHVTGRLPGGAARRCRDDVERAIVRLGLARGVALVPVIADPEAPLFDESSPGERRSLAALAGRLRGGAEDGALRRSFRRALRNQRSLVEHVLHTTAVPEPYAIELCLGILEDAVRALLALGGREVSGAASIAEVLARGEQGLPENAAALYLQLRGLAARSWQRVAAGDSRRALLPDTRQKLRELDRFLASCERAAGEALATARGRRLRRMAIASLAAAALALVVVAILVGLALARPLSPVSDRGFGRDAGGIVGTYYSGESFERKILQRLDEQIDFNYKGGAPAPAVGRDNFSIRWNGYVRFRNPKSVVLCADSDAGARVWIADRLVVDAWTLKRARMRCGRLYVVNGWYPLKVEFHEKTGTAKIRLLTGENSKNVQPVRPRDLCCRGGKQPTKVARPNSPLKAPVATPEPPPATAGSEEDEE
jgi:hypothetical protein